MKINREKDKTLLTAVRKLLKCSNKITIDECDNYIIQGKKGKIYTDGAFWYVYIKDTSIWRKVKEELSFMNLWQNGDREGVLRLDRPPDEKEAKIITKLVGLGKKRVMSDKQRAHMQKFFFKPRLQTPVDGSPIDLK